MTSSPHARKPDPVDCLIYNVVILDGTGRRAFPGAVTLSGDRILEVIEDPVTEPVKARSTIDGQGCILSPGFIDVHTHDDSVILERPEMTPKMTQGVTTVVTGNCGISLAPLSLDRSPPPPLDLLGDRKSYRFPSFTDFAAAVEANDEQTHKPLSQRDTAKGRRRT